MKRSRGARSTLAPAFASVLVAGIGWSAIGPGASANADQLAPHQVDIQAHRGGIGLTTESTLAGFAKAIRIGVNTLELDTQITADGHVVVTHDRKVSDKKCRDADGNAFVGRFVKDLTLADLRTLDCGFTRLADFPRQEVIAGATFIELKDVFELVRELGSSVHLNIETKVEAGAPEETAPREQFVSRVAAEIANSGLRDQVTVQSFDWGALRIMHQLAPDLPLVALTNGDFLEVGKPGASPWLGGIDIDSPEFHGDLVTAAASMPGVTAISPVQGNPQDGAIGDGTFVPYPTAAMVDTAHARGLKVIVWTVDDPATMGYFVDLGADGIITNYPDRLRTVLAERGFPIPGG